MVTGKMNEGIRAIEVDSIEDREEQHHGEDETIGLLIRNKIHLVGMVDPKLVGHALLVITLLGTVLKLLEEMIMLSILYKMVNMKKRR